MPQRHSGRALPFITNVPQQNATKWHIIFGVCTCFASGDRVIRPLYFVRSANECLFRGAINFTLMRTRYIQNLQDCSCYCFFLFLCVKIFGWSMMFYFNYYWCLCFGFKIEATPVLLGQESPSNLCFVASTLQPFWRFASLWSVSWSLMWNRKKLFFILQECYTRQWKSSTLLPVRLVIIRGVLF